MHVQNHIRLVSGAVDEVALVFGEALEEVGFSISPSDGGGGLRTATISARLDSLTTVELFKRTLPRELTVSCREADDGKTRVELEFQVDGSFRRLILLLNALLWGAMLAVIAWGTNLLLAGDDRLATALPLFAVYVVLFLSAFFYINSRLSPFSAFFRRLDETLARHGDFVGEPKQLLIHHPAYSLHLGSTLGFLAIFLVGLSVSQASSAGMWLILASGGLIALLVYDPSGGIDANSAYAAFCLNAGIAGYGLMPALFGSFDAEFERRMIEGYLVGPDQKGSVMLALVAILGGASTLFFVQLDKTMIRFVDWIDLGRAMPLRDEGSRAWQSKVVPVLFWALCALANLAALALLLSMLSFAVGVGGDWWQEITFFRNMFFHLLTFTDRFLFAGVGGATRSGVVLLMTLYSLPLAGLFSALWIRNFGQILRYACLWCRSFGRSSDELSAEERELRRISTFAGLRPPLLQVSDEDGLRCEADPSPIPWFPTVVRISAGLYDKLSTSELGALLAHEVGHVAARHTGTLSMVRFFSRWAFLGEGMLASVLGNMAHYEQEADRFAIAWLERETSGSDREDLVNALGVMEKQRFLQSLGLGAKGSDYLPSGLREQVKVYPKLSPWRRVLVRFALLKRIVYNGWDLGYMHPSFDGRVNAIREMKL